MILVSGKVDGQPRTRVQFVYKSLTWFKSTLSCEPPTVGWGDGEGNGFNYDLGPNPIDFLTNSQILNARIDEASFPPPSMSSLPQAKLNGYDRNS